MKANEKLCGIAAVIVFVGVASCVEAMPDWMLTAVMAGRGHV